MVAIQAVLVRRHSLRVSRAIARQQSVLFFADTIAMLCGRDGDH